MHQKIILIQSNITIISTNQSKGNSDVQLLLRPLLWITFYQFATPLVLLLSALYSITLNFLLLSSSTQDILAITELANFSLEGIFFRQVTNTCKVGVEVECWPSINSLQTWRIHLPTSTET